MRYLSITLVVFALLVGGSTASTSKQPTRPAVVRSPESPPPVPTSTLHDVQSDAEEVYRLSELTRIEQAQIEAAEAARIAAIPTSRPRPLRHSDTWWTAVAICEQGGRNDPYYGYFSVMDGSTAGLDWASQVAIANSIIERYGDSAWAASCVEQGYQAAPGG